MSNMVAHSNNLSPRNLRTKGKELSCRHFVNFSETFANGFNKHTIGSQRFHPFWRRKPFVSVGDVFIPFPKIKNCTLNLLKYILNYFKLPI